MLNSVWEGGLSEALAALPDLEDLSMRSGLDPQFPMLLSTERIAKLAHHWPKLASLDLYGV